MLKYKVSLQKKKKNVQLCKVLCPLLGPIFTDPSLDYCCRS